MARTRQKKKNNLPPFVPVTWEVLNSMAYKSLKFSARAALPYFFGKYKGNYHDPQRYLFEFSFSYTEGKKYGFAAATFSKIIRELIGRGFIDPKDKGGLRSDGKGYNVFSLSKRWKQYGTIDFENIFWERFFPRRKAGSYFKKGGL